MPCLPCSVALKCASGKASTAGLYSENLMLLGRGATVRRLSGVRSEGGSSGDCGARGPEQFQDPRGQALRASITNNRVEGSPNNRAGMRRSNPYELKTRSDPTTAAARTPMPDRANPQRWSHAGDKHTKPMIKVAKARIRTTAATRRVSVKDSNASMKTRPEQMSIQMPSTTESKPAVIRAPEATGLGGVAW